MTLNAFIAAYGKLPAVFDLVPPLREGLSVAQLFQYRYGYREIFITKKDDIYQFRDYLNAYAELYCPIYADRIKALKEVTAQFLEDSDTVKTVTEDTENLRAAPNGSIAQSYSMGGTQRGRTETVTKSGGSSGDPARLAAINEEIRNLYDELFRKFEPLFPEVW